MTQSPLTRLARAGRPTGRTSLLAGFGAALLAASAASAASVPYSQAVTNSEVAAKGLHG